MYVCIAMRVVSAVAWLTVSASATHLALFMCSFHAITLHRSKNFTMQ